MCPQRDVSADKAFSLTDDLTEELCICACGYLYYTSPITWSIIRPICAFCARLLFSGSQRGVKWFLLASDSFVYLK